MKTWSLKKGADRRFRQGHPWIFASELAHSAKEVEAGEVVELRDSQSHFLAYGYAHPSSQICFRRLSSNSKEQDVLSRAFFERRLRDARALRQRAGWDRFSHRWLYAEADGVPGLMIDAFLQPSGEWLAVVQASTAGAERSLPQVYEALHQFGALTVVEAPSSRSRLLEGLKVGEKRVVRGENRNLESLEIVLVDGLQLSCDFIGGQKTGFFLDQQWNAHLLRRLLRESQGPGVRILDICCYNGQWASHASHAVRSVGGQADVHLLDISGAALALASQNVKRAGAHTCVQTEGDALKLLGDLPAESFDVVICDPPAFVKKKADLESGLRAYAKLNRDAMRLVRPGGIFVASSCSGLVKSADFQHALLEASAKAGRTFKQLLQGGHGPDHPIRADFPEGEYLKCHLGQINYPF